MNLCLWFQGGAPVPELPQGELDTAFLIGVFLGACIIGTILFIGMCNEREAEEDEHSRLFNQLNAESRREAELEKLIDEAGRKPWQR